MQKDATANWCFLNALVIQSYLPTVPLLAPSDLRVIATKTNSVTLQWADRSANETGFELWRSVNGGTYSLLKTLGANVVTYKDSALTSNSTYFYIVRSMTASLKSSFTSAVSSTTYAYAVDVNVTDDNIVPTRAMEQSRCSCASRDRYGTISSMNRARRQVWSSRWTGHMPAVNRKGWSPETIRASIPMRYWRRNISPSPVRLAGSCSRVSTST